MFTKFKAWVRRVVSEEVSKIDTSLDREGAQLVSAISIHAKSTLNGLENEAARLLQDFEQKLVAEASLVVAEKNKLIEELHAKVVDLEATARKITHWKADSDTAKADHDLKLVK
jgi:hypothetical protein